MITNPEKNALIIFARYPVLGKVKTRLDSSYGKEFALSFYRECSKHLFTEIKLIQKDSITPYLFCSEKDEVNKMMGWAGSDFKYYYQEGNDLGERMKNAFNKVFILGAKKAVIIGTDVPDISHKTIVNSFRILDKTDVVIGPSSDGGYYLLGIKNLKYDLFSEINWSTETVLKNTLNKIKDSNLSLTELDRLHDIDDEKSLTLWINKHAKDYNNPVYKFVVKNLCI